MVIIVKIFLSPSNHLRCTHEGELSYDVFLAANTKSINSFLNSKALRVLVFADSQWSNSNCINKYN